MERKLNFKLIVILVGLMIGPSLSLSNEISKKLENPNVSVKKSVDTMVNKRKLRNNVKQNIYSNSIQVYLMAGLWKENSILIRNQVEEFKINTLNTVLRLGLVHTFFNARIFTQYGFVFGQSENSSDSSEFSYFQRSVSLTGAELGIGCNLFREINYSLGISLGGIFRAIKHTVPNAEYKFKTASRMIPNLSLDLVWQMSQNWSWRQSIGTQGRPDDTFWSFGVGFLF